LFAFIALKLTGVIAWSWWWVLSPMWISGILMVLAVCALLIALALEARSQMLAWLEDLFESQEKLRSILTGLTNPDAPGPDPGRVKRLFAP
jgi:hypothetical protein